MSKKSSEKNTKSRLPLWLSIIIVVGIIGMYFLNDSFQETLNEAWNVLTSNDQERIGQWVAGFGWLGPLVIIIAMIVQMFLIVVPTLALMVVSIVAYGPIWGSLIVYTAIFCASSVGYFIGSYFGETAVTRLIGNKAEQKIEDFLDDYGFWAIVVTRMNPLLSNDAISFVAGILGMNYWKFIGATLLGITPLTLFIAILGEHTDGLKQGLIYGSIASFLIFGGYIYWDKKIRD
ncbi:TVP38/TMEM64 family protein [Altibacter sp. HG106]|uniref:TVP38/TMEM64 family protein n=1 Tax=Altibacter sp. HG106 TaxID=3023937 RepID=UPI00234FF583|nr:TVP38/TMEM64 family protein [Altibacter sp. HG106]MDC7995098.1 TVP38/TMEM64 family protein [Altibacter sp. HG106]